MEAIALDRIIVMLYTVYNITIMRIMYRFHVHRARYHSLTPVLFIRVGSVTLHYLEAALERQIIASVSCLN